MAIIATFGNQKGGVGKSTLINQLANYIHFNTDYTVGVIDGDFVQESLSSFREFDIHKAIIAIEEEEKAKGNKVSEELKAIIAEDYRKKCYRLVTRDSKTITQTLFEFHDAFNFVLIDLPGSLLGEGVIALYNFFDYVFVPMDITFKDMDSSKKFLDMYDVRVRPGRQMQNRECNVYGVYNKVKEGTVEFKQRDAKVKEMGIKIPFMKNYITETNKLKRDDNTLEVVRLEGIKNPEMIENFCKEAVELMSNGKN